MADRPTCQDCRFWERIEAPLKPGRCRRYPPVLLSDRGDSWTEWPIQPEDSWCGEHERKGIQEVNISESFVVSVGDLEENGNVPLEWVKKPNGGKTS